MKNKGFSAIDNIDRNLALGFCGLVLALILLYFLAVNIFFSQAVENSNKRLTQTITSILANSINRISFSGKYHSQQLVEQIVANEPNVKNIILAQPDGVIFVNSKTDAIEQNLYGERLLVAKKVLAEKQTGFRQFYENGHKINEIIMPFFSGYENKIAGVIVAGISTEKTEQELNQIRAYLYILIAVLALFSLLATYFLSRYFARPIRTQALELQGILEHAPLLICVTDDQGRLLEASRSFDNTSESFRNSIRDREQAIAAATMVLPQELILSENGISQTFLTISFPLYKTKTIDQDKICTIALNISEQKLAEEELRRSRNMLAYILNSVPQGIFWKDQNGVYLGCNEQFVKTSGHLSPEEVVGKTDYDLPWTREETEAYLAADKAVMNSNRAKFHIIENIQRGDGTKILADTTKVPLCDQNGEVYGVLGVFDDITEKQRLMENTQKTQKLESLGILAGGIAHDFNNLLGGIYGYIDLADNISTEPQVSEYLKAALSNMDRARALTQQLLTFAKGGTPLRKLESLIPFLKETTEFVLSGSNIAFKLQLDPDLWCADIDRNQIGQVLDNIIINAKQAMPMGGFMTISADNVEFKQNAHVLLEPGKYVHIAVADQGNGIPSEILPRIFDPFFTTKPTGNGLGLAICYSIVRQHGGSIDVESQPEKGSTFNIYLPASDIVAKQKNWVRGIAHFGSGKILVMDDEKSLRDIISNMLQYMGYELVSAENGQEALKLWAEARAEGKPFYALILDLTIPGGMGGKEVAAEIRKTDTDTLLFVSSGYAADPVISDPKIFGFTDSLRKPFVIFELANLFARNIKNPPESSLSS